MQVEKCNRCSVLLDFTNWYPSYSKKRWHICKDCDKKRQKQHLKDNPEIYERRHLRKYGVTVNQYNKMLEGQQGVCRICNDPPSRRHLCVDHCHETGKIRGLLCVPCNAGLGNFKDNPDLLEEAKRYLECS